ncbi:DUF4345 domain-containing protein [Planomonospora sp. ID67723]|uniref:DUF4345 domain-containing protein n=1 Tax=Planomonospora sp. ID67723 TaxID=2738134 RepID=UPI0018C367AB|nr:DUF4345 domain-containing protein [Planomonospora sp. ID67723]MBG0829382.1 DUF4345 domain-containing protein [Planomonospora sp. ID67723]
MQDSKVLKSVLLVAGLVAVGIGGAILFAPAAFHGVNGIELGGDSNLLSEMRAPGGMLLAIGALVVLGAFVSRLAFTAAVVGALSFLSYASSRVLGIAVDGMPAGGLVLATVLEAVIGLACVSVLLRYRHDGVRTGSH